MHIDKKQAAKLGHTLPLAVLAALTISADLLATDATGTFMDDNRVHLHTRLPDERVNETGFFEVKERMDELGSTIYTRHVKTDDEDPIWKKTSCLEHPP
jgi:hypothetical protein